MESTAETTACLIIIGNEILSGRTRDANLEILGKKCDTLGLRLNEARVIPDDSAVIVAAVNECRPVFDHVFTTGGIGPTHDDITAAAIAQAFNVKLQRNAEAAAALDRYYQPGQLTAARLKMADIPAGAHLIENPVSGAPGFQLENVFVLPGVPAIMEVMLDGLGNRLTTGQPILTRNVMTSLAESVLAGDLDALQQKYPEVSMGSYPYFNRGKVGVNLVLRATDETRLDTATRELSAMVAELKDKAAAQQAAGSSPTQ